MMQEICCPAMEQAIKDEYVSWPITYTKDKQMKRLTPVIHSVSEERKPVFLLNFCPWCGSDVRSAASSTPDDDLTSTERIRTREDGEPIAAPDRAAEPDPRDRPDFEMYSDKRDLLI